MKHTKLNSTLTAFLFLIFGIVAFKNHDSIAQATITGKLKNQKVRETSAIGDSAVKFGKYGCTASKYRNGSVQYEPRGFMTLSKSGAYSYAGFKEPSTGTYAVDDNGNLHFKGGYLDGGEGTKIDRPNKYFLVFPANPDNRWTCGLID